VPWLLRGSVDEPQAKTTAWRPGARYARLVTIAHAAVDALYDFYKRPFLSPEHLADGLGLHYNTVLRAIRRGDLPALAFGRRKDGSAGKPYRIYPDAAARWFSTCGPSTPERHGEQDPRAPATKVVPGMASTRDAKRRRKVDLIGVDRP
jgi:excisionase family DNA binding protein